MRRLAHGLVLLLAAGCGSAGSSGGGSASAPVALEAPPDGLVTSGPVQVRAISNGPDTIELLADDVLFAYGPSPLEVTWDPAGLSSGIHVLTARVTRYQGSTPSVFTATRTVVFERVPLAVAWKTPPEAFVGDPPALAQVGFTTRVDPMSLGGPDSVTVTDLVGNVVSSAVSLSPDGRTLGVAVATGWSGHFEIRLRGLAAYAAAEVLPDVVWPIDAYRGPILNLDPDRPASTPSIAIDGAGRPVVGWIEAGALRVKRLDADGVWRTLGGAIGPLVLRQRLATRPDGTPAVVVTTPDAGPTVYGWDGLTWTPLGLPVPEPRYAYDAALAFDGAGRPVVAWMSITRRDAYSNVFYTVAAARLDGGTWALLGGDLADAATGHAMWPALAVDPLGAPVLSYADLGAGKVRTLRWDAGWTPIGEVSSTPVCVGEAIAPDGSVTLVTEDFDEVRWYGGAGPALLSSTPVDFRAGEGTEVAIAPDPGGWTATAWLGGGAVHVGVAGADYAWLNGLRTGLAHSPVVAVTPAGRVHALWVEEFGARRLLVGADVPSR